MGGEGPRGLHVMLPSGVPKVSPWMLQPAKASDRLPAGGELLSQASKAYSCKTCPGLEAGP